MTDFSEDKASLHSVCAEHQLSRTAIATTDCELFVISSVLFLYIAHDEIYATFFE